MSQEDESEDNFESLPLELLGLVARRLRSEKRPGTERIACVSKRWSKVTQHVSNTNLVLECINTPAKAASLAAWMQRHGHCLGSLSLDINAPPYPQQLQLQLQQVLPALQQAALAAATPPAAQAAGARPLGLTRLVLKGAAGSYPQLGTLLGALRDLRELQLCRGSYSPYDVADIPEGLWAAAGCAALGQQLSGAATCLTRLQRLQLDWYLQGQDLSPVLPPSLTSLSIVLDDDMAGAGAQQLTHLVKLRQLTLLPPRRHEFLFNPPPALSDAAAVAALPSLEEVAVEDRVLGPEALRQLSRHLVRLSYTSNLDNYIGHIITTNITALTSLTFFKTSSLHGIDMQPCDWAPVLPALTALRTLVLFLPHGDMVEGHVAACRELQHLRNLELEVTGSAMQLSTTSLPLPIQLTSLTVLSYQTAAPWHQTLACLQRLRALTVQQDILTRDEDVLTALTALTKLVLLTGTTNNIAGGLQVVALQQVQAVGGRLRELVVVGQPRCRRIEQHLAAILPASCRCVFEDRPRRPLMLW